MITWRTRLLSLILCGVVVGCPRASPGQVRHQAPAAGSKLPRFLTLDVSGPITSDTTWTLANSPYIVTNDVTVNSGVTLTIEAGVVVKFNDDYDDLIVDGTLVADGTAAAPIIFTSINDNSVGGDTGSGTPAGGDWSGMYFNASSTRQRPGLRHRPLRWRALRDGQRPRRDLRHCHQQQHLRLRRFHRPRHPVQQRVAGDAERQHVHGQRL